MRHMFLSKDQDKNHINIRCRTEPCLCYTWITTLTACCLCFRYCGNKLRLVPGILCREHFVADRHRLLSVHHVPRVQR